jgi:excisionase family DNA binding protein
MTNRPERPAARSAPTSLAADPPSVLVPVLTAGRMLGIGRTKVYELVGEGELELVHIGARALVPVESVHDFADRLRARPSEPVWVDGVGVVQSRSSPRGDSQPALPGLQ